MIPLWGVVVAVIILASIRTIYQDGNIFHWLRDFMSMFFIVFGTLKLIKLKDFAIAYAGYDLIAARSKIYALTYPFIEIGLGVLLFFNLFSIYVNIFIAIIMLVGALGIYLKLKKGEKIECACLGTFFKVPMTWVTLLEDLVMAFMAIFMLAVMIWMPVAISSFSFDKVEMATDMLEESVKDSMGVYDIFDQNTEGLPEVKKSEIIELKDQSTSSTE